MKLPSRVVGLLAPPVKTGLSVAGEIGYDSTTGAMSYRDGIAGVDRPWPSTMLGTRSVQGIVNSDGSIQKGTGFTITKNGTGDYTVNLSPAFADIPAVTFSPFALAGFRSHKHSASATASTARVLFMSDAAGTAADTAFHFVALSTSGELGPNPIKTTSIAFTDGDTVRRVSITDASVNASSNVTGSVRRPNTADDSFDKGYLYTANIVEVYSGGFDLLVAATAWGYEDPTEDPPNETVQFNYIIG